MMGNSDSNKRGNFHQPRKIGEVMLKLIKKLRKEHLKKQADLAPLKKEAMAKSGVKTNEPK